MGLKKHGRKSQGKFAKKKSKARSKRKAKEQTPAQIEAYQKLPKTFVFHRGDTGKSVVELVSDLRTCLQPLTAKRLKVRKNNSLQDLVGIAGPLSVTHMVMFSQAQKSTERNLHLRLIRLPRGPTLQFRVHTFSLALDVAHAQKQKHTLHPSELMSPPLVVLNGSPCHPPRLASRGDGLYAAVTWGHQVGVRMVTFTAEDLRKASA